MREIVPRSMATVTTENDQAFTKAPAPVSALKAVTFWTADGDELARIDSVEQDHKDVGMQIDLNSARAVFVHFVRAEADSDEHAAAGDAAENGVPGKGKRCDDVRVRSKGWSYIQYQLSL